MRKKIIFFLMLIACMSFSSFREVCNDNEDETSFKEGIPGKVIPVNTEKDWNLSPLYNLLKI